MNLLIDFETRSRADLPSVGQHIYARHESTEVICIGWKVIGEKENNIVTMPQVYLDDGTDDFKYAVKHSRYVIAHNAAFEQAIWKHTLLTTTNLGAALPPLPVEKWVCTLSLASIMGLPRGLEKAANALGLDVKKDMEGRKLLLQMCKPRRPIQNIGKWLEWIESDDALKRLYEYCRTDLEVEEKLYMKLTPYKPFTRHERSLWCLDQSINQRGFAIDLPLVKRTLELIKHEESELTSDLQKKTFGWVKTSKQVKNMRDFLKDQGLDLPDLQKKTVNDAVATIEKQGIKNNNVIDVLKIRQSLSMSSTSKYESFLDRVDPLDGRVRDNLLFHGASTGRWTGTGVQPQNFPRGNVKITKDTIEDLKHESIEMLRLLYGRPMELFSSSLRGMITASEGHELFCADFASIEARVLLWVAGDVQGLKEYEQGLDTYITMASTIFKKPAGEILKEYQSEGFSTDRQLGKKVILACGYQMGVKKFIQSCKDEGLDVPESVATIAHAAFKEKYPLVPKVWFNYERAAILAVQNKGKKVTINKVSWYVQGDFLFAELPSGRRLAYYGPELRNEPTPWGDERPKLYVWTVDSKTKQWVERAVYGGLLTENIVQAISRDCMAEAMVRCESHGYKCLITVHDENLTEREIGQGSLDEFKKLMSKRPTWGQDIPLKVSAWSGFRYKK
jgi:DNA polymerase bacteriophage-type